MTASSYTSADTSRRLWDASAREARFVVTNYTSNDDHTALKVALSLGLATEYLVMSALASLDVSLLADEKSPYSKLALSQAHAGKALDVKQLRTVVYGVAVKLLRQHKQFVVGADVDAVMNVRNSAAHMAMASPANNLEGLTKMLVVVTALHRHLSSLSEDDFWGVDCLPVVTNLKDEHANLLKAEYDALVLAAKGRFQTLQDGIAQAEREHVFAALERRLEEEGEAWDKQAKAAVVTTCPACARAGRTGWTRILLDDFEQTETYGSATGAEPPAVTVSVEYNADAFKCAVCGLELGLEGVALLLNGNTTTFDDDRYVLDGDELTAYYAALDDYEPDTDVWIGVR